MNNKTLVDLVFIKGISETNIENVFSTSGGSGSSSTKLKHPNDRLILQFSPIFKKAFLIRTTMTTNQEENEQQQQFGRGIIPVQYFEIQIQSCTLKHPLVFGVGLAKSNYDRGMVGWYDESIGYHADDGFVFHNVGNQQTMDNFFGLYAPGDTVGVLTVNSTVYFTKNGTAYPKPFELKNNQESYYATISTLDDSIVFEVIQPNKFKFSIEKFMREELKMDILQKKIVT